MATKLSTTLLAQFRALSDDDFYAVASTFGAYDHGLDFDDQDRAATDARLERKLIKMIGRRRKPGPVLSIKLKGLMLEVIPSLSLI